MSYETSDSVNNVKTPFAEEALAFIKFHKPCYVIIGDFTHFFDFLDHTYLLNQIRSVLDSQYIPDDIYYVLNSLLHYSYVDYEGGCFL